MEFNCKICDNKSGNKFYTVKEMQFGLKEEFNYCECSLCGCLQIVNPPDDLSRFYPKEYFSFGVARGNFLKENLNRFRDRYYWGNNNLAGKILSKKLEIPTYIKWLKNTDVTLESPILDIGCGSGRLLYRMGTMGFKNLLGIDNFINGSIDYRNGVKIRKESLFDLKGKFDLVMMHHSLEHMDGQHTVFKKLSELIDPGRFLLIRIPTCSCFAWRTYKENWLSLDAPRHYFLHSIKSIGVLTEKYGFTLTRTEYDSRSIQLWGSEQYKMGVPLYNEKSFFVNPQSEIFTREQIEEFENTTKKLNDNKEGDQVVLFLRRV